MDAEGNEVKEIEIPGKCETGKNEILISEIPGEVEAEEIGGTAVENDVEITEIDSELVETPVIDAEQTEIPEVGESIVLESNDGSVEMLSKICAQMDTLLESQEAVTEFETESGPIAVVHSITLGDLILSTLLAAVLIMQIISNTIRRS